VLLIVVVYNLDKIKLFLFYVGVAADGGGEKEYDGGSGGGVADDGGGVE